MDGKSRFFDLVDSATPPMNGSSGVDLRLALVEASNGELVRAVDHMRRDIHDGLERIDRSMIRFLRYQLALAIIGIVALVAVVGGTIWIRLPGLEAGTGQIQAHGDDYWGGP